MNIVVTDEQIRNGRIGITQYSDGAQYIRGLWIFGFRGVTRPFHVIKVIVHELNIGSSTADDNPIANVLQAIPGNRIDRCQSGVIGQVLDIQAIDIDMAGAIDNKDAGIFFVNHLLFCPLLCPIYTGAFKG